MEDTTTTVELTEDLLVESQNVIDSLSNEERDKFFSQVGNDEEKYAEFLAGQLGEAAPTRTPADEEPKEPDEVEEWKNPFTEAHVPDSWMIDKKTGKPYENGMILGRYETAEAAFEAVPGTLAKIGEQKVHPIVLPDDSQSFDTVLESEFKTLPMLELNAEQMRIVREGTEEAGHKDGAMMKAVDYLKRAGLFDDYGIDPPESIEDIKALRDIDRDVYNQIFIATNHFAQQNVIDYSRSVFLESKADEYNVQAAESSYDIIVSSIEKQIGEPLNEQSKTGALDELHTAFIEDIQAKFVSGDARERNSVMRYFTQKYGVPILDREKVAQGFILAHQASIVKAAMYAAEKRAEARYSDTENRRVRPQPLASTAKGAGAAPGSSPGMGILPLNELTDPDYFIKMDAKGIPQAEAMRLQQAGFDYWTQQEQRAKHTSSARQY